MWLENLSSIILWIFKANIIVRNISSNKYFNICILTIKLFNSFASLRWTYFLMVYINHSFLDAQKYHRGLAKLFTAIHNFPLLMTWILIVVLGWPKSSFRFFRNIHTRRLKRTALAWFNKKSSLDYRLIRPSSNISWVKICQLPGDFTIFSFFSEKLTCACFSEVARNSARHKLACFPFQVVALGSHLTIRGGSGNGPWWGGSHPRGCSHSARHSSAHTCHPAWKIAMSDRNPMVGDERDLSQPFQKQHPPLPNTSQQHALQSPLPMSSWPPKCRLGCKR